MWIHLLALELIDGAGGGTPPEPTETAAEIPTYLVGKPKKQNKGLGGPRWKRYELEDLARVVTTRPYVESETSAKDEADAAIAKASRQAAEEAGRLAAQQLAIAEQQMAFAAEVDAAILAQKAQLQAEEDAQIMEIIARLL